MHKEKRKMFLLAWLLLLARTAIFGRALPPISRNYFLTESKQFSERPPCVSIELTIRESS